MRHTIRLTIALLMLLTVGGMVSGQDSPLYLDASAPIEDRVEDLLGRMSLEEKVGQMTLIEKGSIQPDAVTEYYIGGVLSGGGGYPSSGNTPERWYEMVTAYQDAALATPLAIPLIYGVDAIHGHNNLRGATIYPHNIGLGAANDADLVRRIAQATAEDMLATGIHWNYAPVLAVPQDYRWGRTYEGYSGDPDIVTRLALAFLDGLQGDDLSADDTVVGTPKHFVGDGGVVWGTGMDGMLDRGDTRGDEDTLREIHLTPYVDLIEGGARSIMVSFSSWQGVKMHARGDLITDWLKDEMGFDGFVVSDWQAIDEIPGNYYSDVVTSVNAGVDMNMVPYNYIQYTDALIQAVENGDVTEARIDDAVRRILRVKFELGLFENPYGDPALIDTIGSDEKRELAREAVQKSAVLLQNINDALPLSADVSRVFIAGEGADDVGIQSGGWTIEWQGLSGNITDGTTILDGLEAAFGEDTEVIYNRFGRYRGAENEDGSLQRGEVGIVVLSEPPYAEMQGDRPSLQFEEGQLVTLERVRERVDKLIVIIISGRPMSLGDIPQQADAMVAAWLPGSEGAAIADVLFGEVPFNGKLSFAWHMNDAALPVDPAATEVDCEAIRYPLGYGLQVDTAPDAQILPDHCE